MPAGSNRRLDGITALLKAMRVRCRPERRITKGNRGTGSLKFGCVRHVSAGSNAGSGPQ
jgi:hypothetical protein